MRRQVIEGALLAAVLACVLVYGVYVRLEDPLSTRALGAEDPWSHVVFTKEWQQQGYFADSFHMGTEMYPPGMHAWLAAFVPFTGVDLVTFARIAPAIFGGLAILGMFVLGQRLSGPIAGLTAAFVTAIIPEHIFRTELLFPTTFDLALLPLWMLAFHLAITGHRRIGIPLFAVATIPIAVMHPWAIPLFGIPLALYAALRAMHGALPRRELWVAAALLVPAIAFTVTFRWNESDTGFSDFASHLPGLGWLATAQIPGPLLLIGLLMALGAGAALVVWILQHTPSPPRVAGVVVGLSLFGLIPLLLRTPQPDVSYLDMLGISVIVLALAGFAVAILRPSALGDLGLTLSLWLFPLTALDIFGSPYWPQRTVAYLCMGVALLAAAFAAEVPALASRLAKRSHAPATAGIASLLVLSVVFAGSAIASPPDTYSWYRLYDDEDVAGFERVGAILDEDATSRVFVYTWQPALLVKAMTQPEHVWYGTKFFRDADAREQELDDVQGPAYVLVEKHTQRADETGKADLSFLEDGRYHLAYSTPDGSLALYEVRS